MFISLKDIAKSFKDIQSYLHQHTGIYLDDGSKQIMVKNRLESLKQYPIFQNATDIKSIMNLIAQSPRAKQLFINAFTTNKTDFFREKVHFQDMIDRILPQLFANQFNIKIYCCACSTGEEPYSIAMAVSYAKEFYNSSCDVEIFASDIDTNVIQSARNGIFMLNPKIHIPEWVQIQKYFNVLQTLHNGVLKIQAKENLKQMIRFFNLNLFESSYPFPKNHFDIVFCRNVLIYFKPKNQEKILHHLFAHLKINGTLYIGHAEDILGLKHKVERLGNKTYIKVIQ